MAMLNNQRVMLGKMTCRIPRSLEDHAPVKCLLLSLLFVAFVATLAIPTWGTTLYCNDVGLEVRARSTLSHTLWPSGKLLHNYGNHHC